MQHGQLASSQCPSSGLHAQALCSRPSALQGRFQCWCREATSTEVSSTGAPCCWAAAPELPPSCTCAGQVHALTPWWRNSRCCTVAAGSSSLAAAASLLWLHGLHVKGGRVGCARLWHAMRYCLAGGWAGRQACQSQHCHLACDDDAGAETRLPGRKALRRKSFWHERMLTCCPLHPGGRHRLA